VRKSSAGPPTQEQPQHLKSSSSEVQGASRLQNAAPAVSGRLTSLQITHEQNTCPNGRPLEHTGVNSKPRHSPEDGVSEDSTEYHAKFAGPHSLSEGEDRRSKLERHLSVLLVAQTERDRRIAQLTDELVLKSALLEQAEANAVEAASRAGPELRERADDRRIMLTSMVKERDVELVNMQARLDELQLSRDQHFGRCERELANVLAKLEAKESELEVVRLRLTDAEKGWTKSKAEADTLRAQTATGSLDRDEDQVTRRLMERMRGYRSRSGVKAVE